MRPIASLVALIATTVIAIGLVAVSIGADQRIPDRWNPFTPLDPAAAETPFTAAKLRRALGDVRLCRAALARGGAVARAIPDRTVSAQCHVRDAVDLSALGTARLASVDMPCPMALRLLMWERHALQPAAREILGAEVARINHYGVFSCRRIRTASGAGGRMSKHATAEAIDISGVTLDDGRRLTLAADWGGNDTEAAFLSAMQDSLCRRFTGVLGPNYNALHADHFHITTSGWSMCR